QPPPAPPGATLPEPSTSHARGVSVVELASVSAEHLQSGPATGVAANAGLTDPVCGMTVGADSPWSERRATATYYFCCKGCLEKFRADPQKYLATKPAEVLVPLPREPREALYTCPMHPQIEK